LRQIPDVGDLALAKRARAVVEHRERVVPSG